MMMMMMIVKGWMLNLAFADVVIMIWRNNNLCKYLHGSFLCKNNFCNGIGILILLLFSFMFTVIVCAQHTANMLIVSDNNNFTCAQSSFVHIFPLLDHAAAPRRAASCGDPLRRCAHKLIYDCRIIKYDL